MDNIPHDWMRRCLPRITSDERNNGTLYPGGSGIGKPAAHVKCNWCHGSGHREHQVQGAGRWGWGLGSIREVSEEEGNADPREKLLAFPSIASFGIWTLLAPYVMMVAKSFTFL